MSQEEFFASLHRLECQIDSNQEELKRDIDRRFGALKDEVNKLKSHPFVTLTQITNLFDSLIKQSDDNRKELCDLPNHNVISNNNNNKQTITSTEDFQVANLNATEFKANKVETGNNFDVIRDYGADGNELYFEGVNGLGTNVLPPLPTNAAYFNELTSDYEQVNTETIYPDLTSIFASNYIDYDVQSTMNNTFVETSNELTQSCEYGNQIKQLKQQVSHELEESTLTVIDNHSESQRLFNQMTKTRERKDISKSLTKENEHCSLGHSSLSSDEASITGLMKWLKPKRIVSSIETQITNYSMQESDYQLGFHSNGEDKQEQMEEDEEELWDVEDECENCQFDVAKMKCIEDGCVCEVPNIGELHAHLQHDHHTSLPYRCMAPKCCERFDEWCSLGQHALYNHCDISLWPCPHCIKTFKTQSLLYIHLYYYHFEGQL